MQDRVPTYPGRVILTPVDGQPNTYDMERADQPTQAGTPINKATLLSDDTALDYGLTDTAGATPNTAFQALKTNRRPWMIGDTLTTMRTDLGDDWLLCNGDVIDKNDYQELASVLNLSTFSHAFNPLGDGGFVNGFYSADGYVVAYGMTKELVPAIAYSDSISTSAWTIKEMPWSNANTNNPTNFGVTSVTYDDGLWVVAGACYISTSHNTIYMSYGSSLDNLVTKELLDSTSRYTVSNPIVLHGGIYWAVFYSDQNTGLNCMYSTSLSGTWQNLSTVPDENYNTVKYLNGNWIICGSSSRSYYYTSDLLSSSWKSGSAFTTTQTVDQYGNSVNNVEFVDGNYVFYAKMSTEEGGDGYVSLVISYTRTLGSAPTTVQVFHIQNVNANAGFGASADGYYWAIGRVPNYDDNILYWSNGIDGPYTSIYLPEGISNILNGFYVDGCWFMTATVDNSVYADRPAIIFGLPTPSVPMLPSISSDLLYTYIRAKG